MLKYKILWKYFLRKGRIINFKNPKLFSEKIQWLKVYDCLPIKTQLADKLAVRDWVAKKLNNTNIKCIENIPPRPLREREKSLNEQSEFSDLGEGYNTTLYLKKIYGIYEKYEDIDFSKLPEEYVIKTNHGCNMQLLVIEGGKPEPKHKDIFNNYLKVNYAYKSGYEMQYKNIKPMIFAEEYIKNTNELFEYLIFCFNGEPKMILFASEKRTDKVCCTMFDTEWNNLHFNYGGSLHEEKYPSPQPCLGFTPRSQRFAQVALPQYAQAVRYPDSLRSVRPQIRSHAKGEGVIKKTKNLDKMLEIARILSKGFKFVRVDLHNIDGKIYFGEMTFTPASGYMKFNPRKYDRILGDLLVL